MQQGNPTTSLTCDFKNHLCLVRLFLCLVRAKLEFGSVAWNSLTATDASRLENVQKRFIRLVYDKYFGRRFYYDYDGILKRLGLQNLLKRRLSRDILFLHKVINGHIDADLLGSVNFHAPARSCRHRSLFYPHFQETLSPLTRMQVSLNNVDSPTLDVFSDCTTFKRNLDYALYHV